MKYLILIFLLLLIFCNCNDNPTGIEEPVTVYLKLNRAYRTQVFCEEQVVTILFLINECDTIIVPNGSQLKAKMYYSNSTLGIVTKTNTASDGLRWELP